MLCFPCTPHFFVCSRQYLCIFHVLLLLIPPPVMLWNCRLDFYHGNDRTFVFSTWNSMVGCSRVQFEWKISADCCRNDWEIGVMSGIRRKLPFLQHSINGSPYKRSTFTWEDYLQEYLSLCDCDEMKSTSVASSQDEMTLVSRKYGERKNMRKKSLVYQQPRKRKIYGANISICVGLIAAFYVCFTHALNWKQYMILSFYSQFLCW